MTDNYRDEIREALGRALDLIGELTCYDNYQAYPPNLTKRVEEFIAPYDAEGLDAVLFRLSAQAEPAERHGIRFIDATPDSGYIQRILSAYIDESYFSDNTLGLPPENELCKKMNEWREQRNKLLREALARLSASGQEERSCETCSAPNGAECTRRNCSGSPAFDRWEPAKASGQGEERDGKILDLLDRARDLLSEFRDDSSVDDLCIGIDKVMGAEEPIAPAPEKGEEE